MGKHKVLVVEDDALMAATLSDTLQEAGYQVVGPVGRLGEATRLAGQGGFCAAVLDYDVDGEPVIPLAWGLHRAGTPLIVFTGLSRVVVERTLPNGTRYVAKAGNLAPLLSVLRELCGRGSRPRLLAVQGT